MSARAKFRCVMVVAGASTMACASRDQPPVRIGVLETGEGLAGARLAASEINNSHGIRGRPLVLRVMSAGAATRTQLAVIAADSLSQDPTVIGIVGHANSSASLAGSEIYNARGVVQVAPTSSAPLLSQAGPYTFRLVASDIHQARFLAGQIADGGAKPPTAVFFVNDDYGRSLHQELRMRLVERGVPLVLEVPYVENAPLTDVDASARAVAGSHAETLVWLGRGGQLRQFLSVLRRVAPRVHVLASDGVDNADTQRNTDGLLTGIRFACFVDMGGSRPALVALRDRYRATTGALATAEMALSYDAVMLLATAAREAGVRRGAIREYLASLGTSRSPFPGVTGDIGFDKDGDPQPSYCLAEVTAQGARVIPPSAGR